MSLCPESEKEQENYEKSQWCLKDAEGLLERMVNSDSPLDMDTCDLIDNIRCVISDCIYSLEQHIFEIGERL